MVRFCWILGCSLINQRKTSVNNRVRGVGEADKLARVDWILELNQQKVRENEFSAAAAAASESAKAGIAGSTPCAAEDLEGLSQDPEAAGAGARHAIQATGDYILALS